jgi:DMSO/TMAO reductase YedYZ molybdopterin-dependent catalytic subunit
VSRDPAFIVLSDDPLNAETRLSAQEGYLTPTDRFFRRNHFTFPAPPWRLVIDGAVRTPLSLTPDDIRALPPRTVVATLECAGNGRSLLGARVPGERWGLGAVGTAEWTGAPLRAVLERATPLARAIEVLCVGADDGDVPEVGKRIAFERSLPLPKAMHEDTLLAYEMNGEALPPEHGAPIRLLVPGWYGMASVKWLARLSVLERPFRGFFQHDRYVVDGRPLSTTGVRALIASPQDGDVLVRGRQVIRGYAWSGEAMVLSVEVSVDGGASWDRADLSDDGGPYAWREWRYVWDARDVAGVTILARAYDANGRGQPERPRVNALGYANNAIQRVRVRIG